MIRSFDGIALRQLRTRRLRALLTGFGIVLGVGMVFGVLLLVGTIRSTFDELIDSAWGKTDVVIFGEAGGSMPNETLAKLRATPGVADARPMIGSIFSRLDPHGDAIDGMEGRMLVAGIDPEHPAYDFRLLAGRQVGSGRELMVERNWARDRGVGLHETLAVATPGGRAHLNVVGIFQFSSGLGFGGQGLAVMPIDAARSLMELPEGYMQIAVQAEDRADAAGLRRQLAADLGPGYQVKTPEAVAGDFADQLQGLNVVLYFFSGIALFVGAFLILNSFNMTVLQRMREIGMLRTLGASRGMIVRSVLIEALVIAVAGTLLGLGVGFALAAGLLELMKGFGMPVGDLHVTAGAAIAAVVVGLLATIAGALHPARRAGRVPPIQAAQGGGVDHRRPPFRRLVLGLLLFLPGVILGGAFWFSDQAAGGPLAAIGGIGMTMLMFVGIALAAPFLIMPIVSVLARVLRRLAPTGGRLAADATRSNPARTSATAVALTIGLSVIVVNTAMSASFVGSIEDQIDQAYARDFTIQPAGTSLNQGGGPVPDLVRKRLGAMPDVAVATPVRGVLVELPAARSKQPGLVTGVVPDAFGKVDLTPVEGASRTEALASLESGGVLISPRYADSAQLAPGDTVALRGPRGSHDAPVAGVLQSSTGDADIQMSRTTMRDLYGEGPDNLVLVKADPGTDLATLERTIDRFLSVNYPNLELVSTGDLKDDLEAQVNQQFNLFNAILAIAVIVSLLGVINTLAMSVLERTSEIGVLRALGSSRWQVRLTMLNESLLITIAGAIAGIVVGTVIAASWLSGMDTLLPGIAFHFPFGASIGVAITAVILGVIAAILPARRAAKLKPVEALNYE
jgi:putative ABC transport system permease protein